MDKRMRAAVPVGNSTVMGRTLLRRCARGGLADVLGISEHTGVYTLS